jgi:acetolactate synthase-1/2/3 large subunit
MDGKCLIHINISALEIGKVYHTDHAIAADAKFALPALRLALEQLGCPVQAWRPERHDYATQHILHVGEKIHPGQLVQRLSALLPEKAILLADAGAHAAWLGYYSQLSRGQNFRKPGSFGPMACNVNGALGLQCAHRDRQVIVGCGDGGYLLSGFELLTAVQYNIPVIWIIFNDGEFKLIKLYQLSAYGEFALVDFNNPDYAAYAKVCGAEGYRVDNLEEFETAFTAALSSAKPTLIDAHITRWAIPHYSSSPEGVLAGVMDAVMQRIHPT